MLSTNGWMKGAGWVLAVVCGVLWALDATAATPAPDPEFVRPLGAVYEASSVQECGQIAQKTGLELNSELLAGNGDGIFLIRALVPDVEMELVPVTGVNGKGEPVLAAKPSRRISMDMNGVYVLRVALPEGVPGLAVCLGGRKAGARHCWFPRHSGMDGSLVLDLGFTHWPLQ